MTDRSTYRVKGLPANVTSRNVAKYLVGTIPNIGSLDNIRVRSVARSLGRTGVKVTKTATFEFVVEPEYFRKSSVPEWTLSNPQTKEYLVIDKTFLGFTPLNDIAEADHTFDCIAISGLFSHPFSSWRYQERSGTHQHMWLRDRLPTDLPGVRVLLYGYETQLFGSRSYKSIGATSQELINRLEDIGLNSPAAKPLIIFAHGFGGIVVKRMITQLSYDHESQPYLMQNIKGLFQFGVPNKGMEIEHIINMIREQINGSLINDLNTHSSLIYLIDEESNKVLKRQATRVISIYETKVTSIRQLQTNGHWVRTGRSALLVNFESAISSLSDREKDVLGINAKHFDITKFASDDKNYRAVRRFMKEVMHSHPVQQPSISSHELQKRSPDQPYNGNVVYSQPNTASLSTIHQHQRNVPTHTQTVNNESNLKRQSMFSGALGSSKHDVIEHVQQINDKQNPKRRSILLWTSNDSKHGDVEGPNLPDRNENSNDQAKQNRRSMLFPLINRSKQSVIKEESQDATEQKKSRRKSFLPFSYQDNKQNTLEPKVQSNANEEKRQRRRSVMEFLGKS